LQIPSPKNESVVVAMSGGVDSSVVAALLKQQGYNVIGITLQIWQESQVDPRHAGCCSLGAVEDARRVARLLDIPHYVMNFKDSFKEAVIDYFVEEYSKGRTPNPCVECNRKVKFEHLLQKAHELGYNKLATGHYARIRFNAEAQKHELLQAVGKAKDQSYVLYMLTQNQLSQLMFPLGELPDKEQTRQLAADLGLPVANKPDSQEICFVSEAGGYAEFIKKQRPELFQEGSIVSESGEVLGKHDGTAGYTIGQRRGLGISSKDGKPLYVLGLEPKSNFVKVGAVDSLLKSEVALSNVIWSSGESLLEPKKVMAKIRYNMDPKPATLIPGDVTKLVFDQPVKAVTPGQIAVAYDEDGVVIVGGVIE
jgi:tRNA-specific 2-thiouridylase